MGKLDLFFYGYDSLHASLAVNSDRFAHFVSQIYPEPDPTVFVRDKSTTAALLGLDDRTVYGLRPGQRYDRLAWLGILWVPWSSA